METVIPNRLSILGHPQRLALFRLLMRRYPGRVPATELARALGLKRNTLSSYIGALMQAGLVTQQRAGTSLRYAVDIDAARETFDYLLLDCCRGRPDLCAPLAQTGQKDDRGTTDGRHRVLFLCTGNSARSILAESILRHEAAERFDACSAGTQPRSEVNPLALELLDQKGHDILGLQAKHIADVQRSDAPDFDFVFTVCDQAANWDSPAWSGTPVTSHWGMPDPAQVGGTSAQRALAFQQAYAVLQARIRTFVTLPIASLDRVSRQRAVDDIARGVTGAAA